MTLSHSSLEVSGFAGGRRLSFASFFRHVRRRLERCRRQGRIRRRLRGGETNLIVIAFGGQQVQQGGAAFFVGEGNRLPYLLGPGTNFVAIPLPPVECVLVTEPCRFDLRGDLRLDFSDRVVRLGKRRFCRANAAFVSVPERERK